MLNKIFKKLFSYRIENYRIIVKILGIQLKFRNTLVMNSKIILVDENGKERKLRFFERIKGLKIHFCGRNCVVKIHRPINQFINTYIDIGSDNVYIEIGKNAYIKDLYVRARFGGNQKLVLGNNITAYGGDIYLDEDSNCYLGSNCLIAAGFQIWGSDSHSIFDKDTKVLLNRVKKPVIIDDNCWFGKNCTVLKHSHISSHTVIGSHSLISGTFNESNVIIAGIPAKIIKRNIDWDAITPIFYEPNIQKEEE